MSQRSVLLNREDIRRVITRIAHEIVEKNQGASGLVLAGLQTRGVPLAHRIGQAINDIEHVEIPVGALDVTLYRDDLAQRPQPKIQETMLPVDINEKRVVLVDDVLFTGRSVRSAMDALTDLGRPSQVQLAILVDRGHRELPIRADYVGKNVPTSIQEEIKVLVKEIDGKDEVIIMNSPEGTMA